MKHGTKIKRTRWAAVIALALVAVPVAQAKPITFQKAQSSQAETAQGLAADAMRLQAQADAFVLTEMRTEGVARLREAKALSQSIAAANAKAYQQQLSHSTLYATGEAIQTRTAPERPSGTAGMFGSSLTPASLTAQASSSPAPISENSPVELRLQPSSPVTVAATGHGFAWRDAGIGAGLAALLTSMLVLGASGVIARRRVAHA